MTKLQKVNEHTGTLEDVYPNLIIVGGKSIAVPVDKQHVVKNMGAEIGDTVWIKYDGRGYLLEAVLEHRGKKEEKATSEKETEKELWIDSSSQIGKGYLAVEAAKVLPRPEPVKEYVSIERRISMHQTTYKECCETARCLMLIPDGAFDEEEYNRLMDIALARSIKDAKALIEAAGEMK